MANVFKQTFDRILKWREDPKEVWGQPSGLASLDRLTGGLHDGEYTVLAGRPSMGKSALAMQIGFHRAREYKANDENKKVVIFSAEMSGWQVVLRELARLARIPSSTIKRGMISDTEQEYLKGILRDMQGYPLILDDTPALGGEGVYQKLDRYAESGALPGLVIYDHLHIGGGEREYERIGSLSSTMQRVARDFNVPTIALAQLSRKVEDRDPPMPVLSDLRGSGSLEQDVDNAWFIYRERKYDLALDQNEAHEAQILVSKARNNGELGSAFVEFVPRFTEFRELTPATGEEVVL